MKLTFQNLIIFFHFSFSFLYSSAQIKSSSSKITNGSPKLVKVFHKEQSEKKLKDDFKINTIVTFNKDGKRLKKVRYFNTGGLQDIFTYKYDSLGQKNEISYFGSDSNLKWKLKNTFNLKSQKTESKKINSEGLLVYHRSYNYDSLGHLIKVIKSDSKGLIETKSFHYDSLGRKIGVVRLKPDTSLIKRLVYNYDSLGEMTQEKEYLREDDLFLKTSFNSKGKIIKEEYFKDGSLLGFKNYEYDVNDNCTKIESFNKDEILTKKILCNYNSKGHILEKATYSEGNFVTPTKKVNYKYEYDEKNNCVLKIIFKNGKTTFIKKEIEYYD